MNQTNASASAETGIRIAVPPVAGYTLELLPGEFTGTWKQAMAWAKEQGGDLPSRAEQILLYQHARGEFKPDWYWSNEQRAGDAGYAWYQTFGWGSQSLYYVSHQLRARAVRRVPI